MPARDPILRVFYSIELCVVALIVLGLGCATTAPTEDALVTDDGLVQQTVQKGKGVLFARADHHIGGYDSIRIGKVEISYKEARAPISDEDARTLGHALRDGVAVGVQQSGLELAKESGACVLKVDLGLHELELYEPREQGVTQTSILSSLGAVTIVFEMSDSMSDRALVRFGERRTLSGGPVRGTLRGARLESMGRALNEMFVNLGAQMAEHTPPTEDPRLAGKCQGLVGRSIGGARPTGGA